MNPFFVIKTLVILSIGVAHGCRLTDNCEPSPSPPPPEPSCPPPPEPSPCPSPPEPSPCPPPPEPSPCPPSPEPSPSPSPSPCPSSPPSSSPPPSNPCLCPSGSGIDIIQSSSTIDVSLYQTAFSIASISETESQLYIQYLNQLPSTEISTFNEIINWYSSKSFTLADSITDFIAFRNEISSIYQLFNGQSIYVADANWASQTSIYEQAKVQFTNALGYCVPGCSLYNLINFACTDVTYMPLVVGTCYYLTDLQYQFYTASSGGSSYYQETSSSHQESASSHQASSSSSSSTMIVN